MVTVAYLNLPSCNIYLLLLTHENNTAIEEPYTELPCTWQSLSGKKLGMIWASFSILSVMYSCTHKHKQSYCDEGAFVSRSITQLCPKSEPAFLVNVILSLGY